MRFSIQNEKKENTYSLIRKIGYVFQREENNEISMVRAFGRSGFPRFHIYLKQNNGELQFNLHLDQKKTLYKGVTAHSGEYDDKIIETEAERIKQILKL